MTTVRKSYHEGTFAGDRDSGDVAPKAAICTRGIGSYGGSDPKYRGWSDAGDSESDANARRKRIATWCSRCAPAS